MIILKYTTGIFVFLTSMYVFSQDCTLDIGGGGNTEQLTSVFQLSTKQLTALDSLQGVYTLKEKALQQEIELLLEKHPQSTPKELTILAEKFGVLEQRLLELSRTTDQQFLQNFNTKQYQRYLELCKEAIRKPIVVTPVVFKDSISPK